MLLDCSDLILDKQNSIPSTSRLLCFMSHSIAFLSNNLHAFTKSKLPMWECACHITMVKVSTIHVVTLVYALDNLYKNWYYIFASVHSGQLFGCVRRLLLLVMDQNWYNVFCWHNFTLVNVKLKLILIMSPKVAHILVHIKLIRDLLEPS